MNKGVQGALREHAYKTEGVMKMEYMIRLLKSEDGIVTSASDLDKQEMLLPVKNGIVNLHTGQLVPANPDLLITHGANVAYDPDAKCPLWKKFLRDIMAGDDDLISYLQRALGYNLTTSVIEGVIFFLYGFGANGKSTFLNIVRSLMGELATQAFGWSRAKPVDMDEIVPLLLKLTGRDRHAVTHDLIKQDGSDEALTEPLAIVLRRFNNNHEVYPSLIRLMAMVNSINLEFL